MTSATCSEKIQLLLQRAGDHPSQGLSTWAPVIPRSLQHMARSRLMGQHGIHLSSCFGKGKANMPDLLRNLPGCHGQGQGYGPHQTWPLWGGEGCRTQNSENGIFSSLPPETSRCPRPQIPYREEGEIPLALPTTYLASCKFTVTLFLALTCIGVPSPLPPQPISSCSYL